MDEELVDAIRNHDAILFIGAGVSKRLGLPSFPALIGELAADLGYDADVFAQLGEYATLAEYYYLERHGLGELRSRLDAAWHSSDIRIEDSAVHRLIVSLECPLIYTTNWDRWLERAFEHAQAPYQRIASVADLRSVPSDVVQIVKFHGDFSSDESLVLTESSYMRRMDLASPLDIKLRSDVLGKSVLFVGYSLRDPNTRLLLFRLHELWKETPYSDAQPRSFLVNEQPNAVQERVLREWGVTTLVAESDDRSDGVLDFLRELAERAHGKTGVA